MADPILSVLICTVPSRGPQLSGLVYHLGRQAEGKPVEILYLGDNKCMSVGKKRNLLIDMARGDYVCFVDDDDRVSSNYIRRILEAAETRPDCIVFDVEISENGGPPKRVVYDKDFKQDRNLHEHFERLPNHLMPVRCGIARYDLAPDESGPFPEVSSGEDFSYARKILPHLKTQVRISETLYFYDYNQALSETPR